MIFDPHLQPSLNLSSKRAGGSRIGEIRQEAREPLEALLETWWESREPKVIEDCQGHGVRRVKPAVQGSPETLGKMVLKGLQDSRVRRVTQESGSRAPLGKLVLQV